MTITLETVINFGIWLITSGVLISVAKSIKAMNDNVMVMRTGMQSLLRYELLTGHKQYMADGHMSYLEKQTWLEMYEMYHRLGANGVMDGCHEDILKLPLEE